MKRTTTLAPALWLVLCPAVAQTTTDRGTGEANTQAPPQTGQPPVEMSLLDPRIGSWEATIRTEPSEGLPKGGIDKGLRETNVLSPLVVVETDLLIKVAQGAEWGDQNPPCAELADDTVQAVNLFQSPIAFPALLWRQGAETT